MTRSVIFDPFLPWEMLAAIALAMAALLALAALRGLSGWPMRTLASALIVLALANPALQTEEREPLSDIVLIVADDTASQALGPRANQTETALADLLGQLDRLGIEHRLTRVADAEGDGGTLLLTALQTLVAETPRARIAGTLILSDGQIHDANLIPEIPAPTHLLLTGEDTDWDRRLVIENAPSFAILGEEFTMTVRVDDTGAVPGDLPPEATLLIAIDGEAPQSYRIPTNRDLALPLTLPHGGMNVMQFTLAEAPGELTTRNNSAVVQINGIRDRLRVLLVSGQPHPGQRTWRNLLKSDSAVDLVHFTILRPPGKQDGVPVNELSLIAFPTRELFLEKIDEFDLIIFDRYRRRGILSPIYIDNVRQYVERGGALLVAAGPDFATAESLYRSALAPTIAMEPTARVIEEGFTPEITDLGDRHPVTEGLAAHSPLQGTDTPWGRWFRQVELAEKPDRDAQTIMSGINDAPLLTLERVGEGRVALLASDHVWLWDRGFEGGGPQLELLRRLAHWMMKEPELEEEALTATAEGQQVTVTRRSLAPAVGTVMVTHPDGTRTPLELSETAPGRFTGTLAGTGQGLYRLEESDQSSVFALGPAAPREFVQTIASPALLQPLIDARRGGVARLETGTPDLRTIREGRTASGRGWLGITPRGAWLTTDLRITSLVPAWLFLLLASALSIWAWLREGR